MPRPKPLTVQSVRFSVPALSIPALVAGAPPCTVRPDIAAVALELMAKPAKLALLRNTVSTLEPGPLIVTSEEMVGSTLVKVIVPVNAMRSIVSEPLLLPAAHSPAVAPDVVLVLAAVIASRKVHKPSVPFATSEVLLTVMVLPAAGVITPSTG